MISISEKKKTKTCYIDGSRHCGRPPFSEAGAVGAIRCCDGLPECRGSKRCYGDASTDGAFGWDICSMVLEYAHQHLPHKWPSHVGKYTSTMEHMGMGIHEPHFFLTFDGEVWSVLKALPLINSVVVFGYLWFAKFMQSHSSCDSDITISQLGRTLLEGNWKERQRERERDHCSCSVESVFHIFFYVRCLSSKPFFVGTRLIRNVSWPASCGGQVRTKLFNKVTASWHQLRAAVVR